MTDEQHPAGEQNDFFDILVLNGPNLDQLAKREPEQYGFGGGRLKTLGEVEERLRYLGKRDEFTLDFFQSNAEHLLIERICKRDYDCLIFNPAGFTHTSIALRDALLAQEFDGKREEVYARIKSVRRSRTRSGVFIEVHISNVHAREPFRHTSYFSDIAFGTISGLGVYGYELAYTTLRELKRAARVHSKGWNVERKYELDSVLLWTW